MAAEALNPKDYLDTNKDGIVQGQEMLDELKQFSNREKVWKNVQEFLKTPEAAIAKQELKDLSEKEIKNICTKTDNTVDRLLSMVWKANGTYWGEQVYTGEFVGQKISAEDRSYYGILCLYDQLVGKNEHTTGRGYFKDAQYWLKKIHEDQTNTTITQVVDDKGVIIKDENNDGKADKVPPVKEITKGNDGQPENNQTTITTTEGTPTNNETIITTTEGTPTNNETIITTTEGSINKDVIPVDIGPKNNETIIVDQPKEEITKKQEPSKIEQKETPSIFSESFNIVDVPSDDKPDAGKLLNLVNGAKTDLVTAAAHPDLFDYDPNSGQFFPRVSKIQQYYQDRNLGEVQFMMPGATFESGSTLTGLSIDASPDDRKSVGSDKDIFGDKAKGMGVLIVTKDGEMILSHTSENPTIPDDADVTTMISVKRNGKLNPKDSVYSHKNGHYIVEKTNGDKAILMLDDCTPEQKKKILASEEYKRVLYCDTNGAQGQLDAYWIHKDNDLTYGNHANGNILRNKNAPDSPIRGNMPSLLVVYKPRPTETNKVSHVDVSQIPVNVITPVKKEETTKKSEVIIDTPIQTTQDVVIETTPIQQDVTIETTPPVETPKDEVIQLDVDNYEKFLRPMIAPKSGVTLEEFVDAVNNIADQDLKKKIVNKIQILYDASAALVLAGIPKEKQRPDGKIDKAAIQAFRNLNPDTRVQPKQEHVDIQAKPVETIVVTPTDVQAPQIIETPITTEITATPPVISTETTTTTTTTESVVAPNTEETNVDAPVELTPSFIDLTKIAPEQKTRLRNSVVGIKMEDLVSKVNNMDDKGLRMQIIDQLLFVDGGSYGAMRLMGMSDNAFDVRDKIPSHHKIDTTALSKFERKNRVYREYETILFNKKLISNEFGQKAPIPEDVKSAYKMFAYKSLESRYHAEFTSRVPKPSREIKNAGKNYAIVSKTDGHVYLFDNKHALVSRKAALLGRDRSNTFYDVKNYTDYSQIPDSTPAGLYTIGSKAYVDGDIGYFMTLEPKDNQIVYRSHKSGPNAGKYVRSIGFHKIYEPQKDARNTALKSDNVNAKFMTNGCINIDKYSYGELYDHLAQNAAVYVTA